MPNAIQNILFSKMGVPRLERALDLSAARQRLLSQNVANAETPGYQRQDIDFDSELKAAQNRVSPVGLKTTRPGHTSGRTEFSTYRVHTSPSTDKQGSGVQLDQEMAKVAENQLQYATAARLIKNKFEGIQLAIRGRR